MGDLVGDAPEEESLRPGHALVPHHDQVRLGLLRHVEERVGRVALARMGVHLDTRVSGPDGGGFEHHIHVLSRPDPVRDVGWHLPLLLP